MEKYRRLLIRYLAPQRSAVLLMAVLLIVATVLQLAGPQVARVFIDAAQAGAAERVLTGAALAFIAVTALQQVMKVLSTFWSERVAWAATNALRADLASHLLHLDLGFYKAHTPGELIERVDGDVNALAGFFSTLVVQLGGGLLLVAGVLVALYRVDRWLGLAFTAFAALALLAMRRVQRFAVPRLKRDREASAAFYGAVGELLTAADDLRAAGAEAYAMRRFFEQLRGWLPIRLWARLGGDAVWIAAIALFGLGDAIAYALGGGLYRSGALSLGAVYMVVAYTAMLASPIDAIRTQLQELQRAQAAAGRVGELLGIQARLEDGADVLPAGALPIELEGVRFEYEDGEGTDGASGGGRTSALCDLSFTLAAGRTLALLGRTGSGKTTVARLLFRFYDPQEGSVRLGGVDLRRARLAQVRARVGLVTQDVQLFAASLRDNITFFDPAVPDDDLRAVLDKLDLGAWLARLPKGLDTMISGAALSAGEAQLVALARLFLKDPGLIILDEAASRLDPATEALLERALDRLLQSRTVVIIAHRLATVGRADDVLILEGGRAAEQGPRAGLAADPGSRFAELLRVGLEEVLI